jgi:hypothetical protein
MIVEDKEVRVLVKRLEPKINNEKDNLLTSTQTANQNPKTDKVLELEECKSSWMSHLLKTDLQMHSSVRDYIVNSERLNSLLKDFKGKKVYGQNYFIRIRTKFCKEIPGSIAHQLFSDFGIAIKQ